LILGSNGKKNRKFTKELIKLKKYSSKQNIKKKILPTFKYIKSCVILEEVEYIYYLNVMECRNIMNFRIIIADVLFLWVFQTLQVIHKLTKK